MKYKLLVPSFDISGRYRHENDTSRELFSLWEEHNLVSIVYSKDIKHPYLYYKDTKICLYEWDRFEYFSEDVDADYVLFACPPPQKKFKYESVWTYWARHPKKLELSRYDLLTYKYREIETFFAGKIENPVQHKNRNQSQVDWSKYIEDFSCPVNGERKYTQEEYLEKIKHSKYGLCLPGFGNKCNREIELLAMGTVPIITPGVDVSNYFDPLIENVHYIYVKNGDELRAKLHGITEFEWIEMSQNGIDWYEKNCSPSGSFETTLKAIDKLMNTPESFSTLATNISEKDLDLLYYSLRKQYPTHDLYLACDDYIANWAILKNDLHLHTNNALQKYASKNRQQMEKDGTWTDFMLEKCTAIDDALSNHNDTLFLDSDQCIINRIEVDTTKDIGLSHHMIHPQNEKQFGKYNGGFVYVNNKEFTKWWRDNTPGSKYMEQGVLEEAPKTFSTFEFGPEYNFGWWRLLECENSEERAKKFTYDNCLKYDNKPVVSLHTHFFENNIQNQSQFLANKFNEFIFNLLPNDNDVKKYIKTLRGDEGLILLQSYYNPKQEDRKAEIEYCLEQNLNNPNIQKVILFLDNESVEYPEHSKIEALLTKDVAFPEEKGAFTFSMAFGYAMQKYKDSICCLINNDVFLDHDVFSDLTEIQGLVDHNIVLSLSRHEYNVHTKIAEQDQELKRLLFAHSQDVWVWKANFIPKDSNFNVGTLGSDNAINHRLKESGKIPINLGEKYKVYHVDSVRGKKGGNKFTRDASGKIKGREEFHDFSRETYPEESGQYLTPDYVALQGQSLDSFANQLQLNHIDKYRVMCEMMTMKVKIQNR